MTTEAMLKEIIERLDRIEGRSDPILTTDEAMRIARKRSRDAFYRWAKDNKVVACGHGLWPRAKVELAVSKQARRVKA